MAHDYAPDVKFAKQMVAEYGRSVTFRKLTQVPTDADKPWDGAADGQVAQAQVMMVFVPASSFRELGLRTIDEALLKRVTQVSICAPVDGQELETFDDILEADGSRWHVEWSETFRPGGTTLLYFIGVKR